VAAAEVYDDDYDDDPNLTEREKYMQYLRDQCVDADRKLSTLRDELNSNDEYRLLLLNYLEPYLDDFRAKMKYIEHPGHAESMVPYHWKLGPAEYAIEVPSRVQLRKSVADLITRLCGEASLMTDRYSGDPTLLRHLYLAMSTARYAHDILNNTTGRRGDNRIPRAPKIKKGGHGGARKGAGRPRKHPVVPPAGHDEDDSDEDEQDDY
jgi:hypothetical protein